MLVFHVIVYITKLLKGFSLFIRYYEKLQLLDCFALLNHRRLRLVMLSVANCCFRNQA